MKKRPIAVIVIPTYNEAASIGKMIDHLFTVTFPLIKNWDCKVLIVDDLLATGGTCAAACNLVTKTGADIVGCAFVIELNFLEGRNKLPKDTKIVSMVQY